MKYALVNGVKQEAQPGLSGQCLDCAAAMIAKCGQHKIWHWAHVRSVACDPWWEPETEWHRGWKNRFPAEWQEVSHLSASGERHRADIKTAKELVIEFQHSALHVDERMSREEFYPSLVWVVNAQRRKRDRSQFFSSLSGPLPSFTVSTFLIDLTRSALMRDWSESRVPVYFDFGEFADAPPLMNALWRLAPRGSGVSAYVSPLDRTAFVSGHLAGENIEDMFTHIIQRDAVHHAKVQNRQSRSPIAYQPQNRPRRF